MSNQGLNRQNDLLARIGYYWLRGGGDREAKPPLL